jgi:hypothetical protein
VKTVLVNAKIRQDAVNHNRFRLTHKTRTHTCSVPLFDLRREHKSRVLPFPPIQPAKRVLSCCVVLGHQDDGIERWGPVDIHIRMQKRVGIQYATMGDRKLARDDIGSNWLRAQLPGPRGGMGEAKRMTANLMSANMILTQRLLSPCRGDFFSQGEGLTRLGGQGLEKDLRRTHPYNSAKRAAFQ